MIKRYLYSSRYAIILAYLLFIGNLFPQETNVEEVKPYFLIPLYFSDGFFPEDKEAMTVRTDLYLKCSGNSYKRNSTQYPTVDNFIADPQGTPAESSLKSLLTDLKKEDDKAILQHFPCTGSGPHNIFYINKLIFI
ncbi:hypothetical protein BVX99_03285 [bacterium F16]|nr:hypothetical protein BVX99_03285 [bacterium F16]